VHIRKNQLFTKLDLQHSYKKLNVILDKLETVYGKWSDSYKYEEYKGFRYFVIWGAKYKKNNKNLFRVSDEDFAYGRQIIGGKLYLSAEFNSDTSNIFNDHKSALSLQLYSYKIIEDALAAEKAKIKQQHKKEDDLNSLEFK